MIAGLLKAGVAQLVERNLAKVEVASSNLVSRSNINSPGPPKQLRLRFHNVRHAQCLAPV